MPRHRALSSTLVGLAVAAAPVALAAATVPASAQAATTTYTVRSGDTLTAIASRYHVTVAQLVGWNHLSNANAIRVGQVLAVSGASTPAPTKPAPATPSVYAPGTRLSSATVQQVLVADRSTGSYGSFARYEWRGAATGWVRVGSSPARFGWGGMKLGSQRVGGDGSTPIGTYPMMETFGVGNPGTKMPYRKVTNCSWWSDKPATYNRFVEQCGHNSGEHLATYTTNATKQYLQTAVVGFNWNHPIQHGKGSGDAIFVHYSVGPTAGCVGVTSRAEMTATVRWLDPAKHPTIVITG